MIQSNSLELWPGDFLRRIADEHERDPEHFAWKPHDVSPQRIAHILRFDPRRMLAEVEAKRRIVELHRLTVKKEPKPPFDPHTGKRTEDEFEVTCDLCGWASTDPSSGCETLLALSLPYADRPGYDPTWAAE